MDEFRFRLLGPVRAWRGETELEVGPPQQQAVLAVLLLSRGTHVSMASMLDALWGENPPKSGAGAVRTYVSRLRQILGAGDPEAGISIEPIGDGYALRGKRLSVDVDVFEERVAAALAARRDGAEAAELCREALAEWRGVPLVGVPGPYFEPVRTRMIEMRADAAEIEAAVQVQAGRHLAAIANLRTLITSYPLRESLYELLMLALYRAGRQADALDVYERARRILRDELGIEPGPSLKRMQQRVLCADDALVPVAAAIVQADVIDRAGRTDRLEALGRQLIRAGGAGTRGTSLVTTRSRHGLANGCTALAVRGEFAGTTVASVLGIPPRGNSAREPGPEGSGSNEPRRGPGRIPAQRSESRAEPHIVPGDVGGASDRSRPRPRDRDSLAQRLQAARRRAFVGREHEIAAFRSALDDTARPFTLLFVTGPGGIGKTSLLRRFADEAAESGRAVIELDGARGDVCSTSDFEAAAQRMLAVEQAPAVLLVDGFEHYQPFESWLREDFLPRLPLGSVVVLAGRRRPGRGWRGDPAWREILERVELRALTDRDAERLLAARGVPEFHCKSVLTFAAGNPLALSLAADEVDGVESYVDWMPSQELVGTLLDQLVLGHVPSAEHRRALEVCALLPATNEEMLRATLPDADAGALFGWLRELPFIDSGPRGVHPHDVVREILDADLRWRDPERHQVMRTRILSRLADGVGAMETAFAAATIDVRATTAETGETSRDEAPSAVHRDDFNAAIRAALRAWHRPDTLARSPLGRMGLVPVDDRGDHHDGVVPADRIRAVISEALRQLRADRDGERRYLAIAATYLNGDARQQQTVADELGLPFGTYRRHLTQGLDRLCELLWHGRLTRPDPC